MSEFDNQYLCPMCDYVDSICDEDLTCGKCGYEPCFVARHINEGTRKFWIEKEQKLGNWRFEKRFSTMIKDSIPKDKELIKNFQKSVKGVFKLFGLNKNNLQEIFPRYTRDYKRTTGRRETGWKRKGSESKQKQGAARGALYEGAMNNLMRDHEFLEPVRVPIPYHDSVSRKESTYEPDFWFRFEDQDIPVEFKTFGEGSMVKSKFLRGIKQSRRYGHLSYLTHNNPQKYSAIIVCCPEERTFSCAIVDDNANRL